jgi:hypothetical protein
LCPTFTVQLNVSTTDKLSAFKEISSYAELPFLALFFTICFPTRTCEVTFMLKMAKFVQNYSGKKAIKGKEERKKERPKYDRRTKKCACR